MTNEIKEIRNSEDYLNATPGEYNCWIAKIYNKNNPEQVAYFQGMTAAGCVADINLSDYYPTEEALKANLKACGISIGERDNGLVVEPARKVEYVSWPILFNYRADAHKVEPDEDYIDNSIADAAMEKEKADLANFKKALKNNEFKEPPVKFAIYEILDCVERMQESDEKELGYFTADTHQAGQAMNLAIRQMLKAGKVRID